ncbi:CHAT domain-containing protein [bacterium]|nr:CHAT domain-containing protein [bacterium]
MNLGRYDEAMVYLEEAGTILEKMPSLIDLAYAKGRIGTCLQNMGDLARAREYELEAIRGYEKIGRMKSVASRTENLAFMDQTLGNYESALIFFDKAKKIYMSLGHKYDAARIHGYIAGLWGDHGDYKKALEEETRAYELKTQGGAVLSAAWNLVDIARYQMLLKKPTAESTLKEAMSVFEKAKLAEGVTSALQTLGDLRLTEKNFMEAEKLLSQVTLEDEKSGYILNWEAWYSLGLAKKGLKKRAEALESFRKSIAIIEKLRNSVVGQNRQEQLFLNKYRKIYDSFIETLLVSDAPQRNDILEANFLLERLKIAEAQENSRGVVSSTEDPKKQVARRKIQSLHFSEVDIEKQIKEELSKPLPDKKRLQHLRELQRANRQESSEYTAKLKEQYPDLFEDQEVKPEQLEALMEDLPPDVMILVPTLLEEKKKVAILGYTRAAPFYREKDVTSKEDFYEKLNDFRNLLSSTRSSEADIKQVGHELYELLIEPVEYLFSDVKLLIVSPSGRLRNIPFQALNDGNRYLIEKMPIVNLAYLKISPPQYATHMRLFAIANPDTQLQGADEQVDKLQGLFPITIKRHAEATQAALKWVEGENDYSILIFASHAELNDAEPRKSYIQLAGDEQLTYSAISGFKTYWKNVDLVVLSACKTAQQPLSTDNSAAHNIAFEFDKSGVHSTIATLWQVMDLSTSDLFTSFFLAVKKKEPMGRALQKAQIDLMKSEKYSHPFYWAPFIFIGDWR